MDKLAAETLPEGFGTEWTTLAYQQIRAGSTAMFALLLAGDVQVTEVAPGAAPRRVEDVGGHDLESVG
jgi:hypothetical protein